MASGLPRRKRDCLLLVRLLQLLRSLFWPRLYHPGGTECAVWLRYFDIKRNDDMPFETQWSHLSAVAAEIDRFAPVLLSDEGAAPPVTASLKSGDGSPAWLATRARWGPSAAQAGKDFYLFVANDGNGGGKVQFQLAGTSIGADGVSVVSETPPRKIQPDDASSFSDEVKRLDVVVYRFTPK